MAQHIILEEVEAVISMEDEGLFRLLLYVNIASRFALELRAMMDGHFCLFQDFAQIMLNLWLFSRRPIWKQIKLFEQFSDCRTFISPQVSWDIMRDKKYSIRLHPKRNNVSE